MLMIFGGWVRHGLLLLAEGDLGDAGESPEVDDALEVAVVGQQRVVSSKRRCSEPKRRWRRPLPQRGGSTRFIAHSEMFAFTLPGGRFEV